MENPLFVPELMWPTVGASGAHGSMVKSSDWVISESSATPLYIPPPHEEANDEGCDELLSGHMTQRSHVPSGQRHVLLTRRNTMFERRIGSNTRASNKDGDCMAEDRVGANTPFRCDNRTHVVYAQTFSHRSARNLQQVLTYGYLGMLLYTSRIG